MYRRREPRTLRPKERVLPFACTSGSLHYAMLRRFPSYVKSNAAQKNGLAVSLGGSTPARWPTVGGMPPADHESQFFLLLNWPVYRKLTVTRIGSLENQSVCALGFSGFISDSARGLFPASRGNESLPGDRWCA